MSRTKFVIRETQKANAEFDKSLAAGMYEENERKEYVETWVEEAVADAEYDAAYERETFGYPEDSPCVQTADIFCTGEGQYHGVI